MSGEIIAIVTVGLTLAGLIVNSNRGLRQDITQLRQDMKQMESRLDGRITSVESQIGELRERMAHLEGLLEGLREAIAGRPASR